MRFAGLVLVLVGFLWLGLDQLSLGPSARVAIDMSAKEVQLRADDPRAARHDDLVWAAAMGVRELDRLLPNFLWPGAVMLLGGLVLFREGCTRAARPCPRSSDG